MHADEIATENASAATGNPKSIASWGHLFGFLLIMAGIAALGYRAQHVGAGSGGAASAGQLAGHGNTNSYPEVLKALARFIEGTPKVQTSDVVSSTLHKLAVHAAA